MFKISLLLGALLAFNTPAMAEYPEKDITLVVPWGQGGGTDTVARAFAKSGKKHLGVDVNVINKTGGLGIIGMSRASVARADGYTVGMITFGLSTFGLMGVSELTYRDYDLIMLVNQSPAAISVRSNSEFKTLGDLIQHARNNRGRIKVGHTGAGAAWHLSGASLAQEHGVDFSFVPVSGSAKEARDALIDGKIDAVTTGIDEVKSLYDAGQINILAVNATERQAAFPKIPTFAEAGYPVGSPILDWRGLAMPDGVPTERAEFLKSGFKKMFDDPEFREFCKTAGINLIYKNAPDYEIFLADMEDTLVPTIESVGLRAEK